MAITIESSPPKENPAYNEIIYIVTHLDKPQAVVSVVAGTQGRNELKQSGLEQGIGVIGATAATIVAVLRAIKLIVQPFGESSLQPRVVQIKPDYQMVAA